MDSPKGKSPSQAIQFQANPQPNVQANSSECPAQAVSSANPSRHVKFQAGPTPTYTPPSLPFAFQAGPALAYPKPALSPTPSSLITSASQPQPTYAGYGKDLKKLHRLEGEVEDLKKRYSDVQRDVGLLTQQDEQDRGRSSQRRPPPPPPVPPTDQHRLRREEDYKKAVAEKAHNDAKRVEVEVKRQIRCNDIEDKRKDWWHKNKQCASPVHRFPVTPATTAKPVISFATTLACRPGSSASAAQNSSSSLAVAPPVPAPSKIPLPNRSRSCSQSAEQDAADRPVHSRNGPALKGILVEKTDGQTREPQTPLKFLRFNNLVKVARIVDEQEDEDGDDGGGSSGGGGGGRGDEEK